jgi:hypothetical protein
MQHRRAIMSEMTWRPATTAELQRALKQNALPHESAAYEYKQQLPAPRESFDIAVDVSAMTVDGGVIIYGVGEDKTKVSFFEHPIDLQGVNDRISNTVVSNVRERPVFDVQLLTLDSDPSKGFVIVEVPASPRAPHMVEVKGEYRFYGRVPGGNVLLTENEIAQLYERRRGMENQGKAIVDAAIAAAPIEAEPGRRGDLHVVFRPLLADGGIRRRAFEDDDGSGLAQEVINSHNSLQFRTPWDPKVADVLQGGQRAATLDGVTLFNEPRSGSDGSPLHRYFSRLELLDDGLIRYFHAAIAADTPASGSQAPRYALRDPAASQIIARLAKMTGTILERAQYQGLVDVYVAILGAKGAISAQWMMRGGGVFPTPEGAPMVSIDDYRNEVRVGVGDLVSEPLTVSARLLDRLLRTIQPTGATDPMQLL